jgi:hypothetical protein
MASTLGAKGVSEAGKESKWCLVVHGGRHVACRPRKTPMYWTVGGKKQEAGETVGGKKGWRWERENCCLGRAHMCDSVREKREKERERERESCGGQAVVLLCSSKATAVVLSPLLLYLVVLFMGCLLRNRIV